VPSVWNCCPRRRFAGLVRKDEPEMTQMMRVQMTGAQTATPGPQPLAGLALLLAEMQALAQLMPGFGSARGAATPGEEA
jgi:hypothetical protein